MFAPIILRKSYPASSGKLGGYFLVPGKLPASSRQQIRKCVTVATINCFVSRQVAGKLPTRNVSRQVAGKLKLIHKYFARQLFSRRVN